MSEEEEEKDDKKSKRQKVLRIMVDFDDHSIDILDIYRIEKGSRLNPDFEDDELLEEQRPDDPMQYGIIIRCNSHPFVTEFWYHSENRRDGRLSDLRERLSEKGVKFI